MKSLNQIIEDFSFIEFLKLEPEYECNKPMRWLLGLILVEAIIGFGLTVFLSLYFINLGSLNPDQQYNYESLIRISIFIIGSLTLFFFLPIVTAFQVIKKKRLGGLLLGIWSLVIAIPVFLIPLSVFHFWLLNRSRRNQPPMVEPDAGGDE